MDMRLAVLSRDDPKNQEYRDVRRSSPSRRVLAPSELASSGHAASASMTTTSSAWSCSRWPRSNTAGC
jgi:hypothetical protein